MAAVIRTVTTLINNLAIAAATPAQFQGEAVTAFATDSCSYSLHAYFKPGGVEALSNSAILYFCDTANDGTNGIHAQVFQAAYQLQIRPGQTPGQFVASITKALPVRGGNLHWWVEIPSFRSAAHLTLVLVESNVPLIN